jgi:ankyrin repeat protein
MAALKRTPLLLILDGILSQDESQTKLAMVQMSRLVPSLREELKLSIATASVQGRCHDDDDNNNEEGDVNENDVAVSVLSPFRFAESLIRVMHRLLESFPQMASIPSGHDGSLPLHFAASIGNVPLARLLLEHYPVAASTPNSKGKIPLHYAAREGRTNMVIYLLQAMPHTAAIESKKRKLALHFAAGDGHVEVVRALLRVHPAGASLTSGKGKLPLHFAARWGHMEIAYDLCRIHPESCSTLDWEGSLPLHDAAREGQVEMSQFLVQRYPEGLSTANIRGEIPLFPAVRSGNVDLVVCLLQAWPPGGKHILQTVGPDDNVAEWDESILDLCLRGAVENFSDCTLIPPRDKEDEFISPPILYSSPAGDSPAEEYECQSPPCKSTWFPAGNKDKLARVASSLDHPQDSNADAAAAGQGVASLPQTPPMMEITLPRSKSPILEGEGSRKKRAQSSTLTVDGCSERSHKRLRCGSICGEDMGEEEQLCKQEQEFGSTIVPSRPFIPLHAALECGASCHVVKCVLERYPERLHEQDGLGRLPLHLAMANCKVVTSWCNKKARCGSSAATSSSSQAESAPSSSTSNSSNKEESARDQMVSLVLKDILDPFPQAAGMRDHRGRLPLHAALMAQSDHRVVLALLEANPFAGVEPCQVLDPPDFTKSTLQPIFMATEYNCNLTIVYTLLRLDPGVIQSKG